MQKIELLVPVRDRLDSAIFAASEMQARKISKGAIRKLIVAGAVYVRRKRVRVASRTVDPGTPVTLYWNEEKTQPSSVKRADEARAAAKMEILFEDESLVAFDKPAGLPTQPTLDDARLNLYKLAQDLIDTAGQKRFAYLGLHHRLDRDTSGVVIFTKDQSCNEFIGDIFKEHRCLKLYAAVVHGRMISPTDGSWIRHESFLGPVGKSGKKTKFGSVRSGGKKAITEYRVVQSFKRASRDYSLVEVRILTGRTHQIRVHLSELNHAVVGDLLYGSPVAEYTEFKRHLLHHHVLELSHPTKIQNLRIVSPIPKLFREFGTWEGFGSTSDLTKSNSTKA